MLAELASIDVFSHIVNKRGGVALWMIEASRAIGLLSDVSFSIDAEKRDVDISARGLASAIISCWISAPLSNNPVESESGGKVNELISFLTHKLSESNPVAENSKVSNSSTQGSDSAQLLLSRLIGVINFSLF